MYRTGFHKASFGACRCGRIGAIRAVIAPGGISRLPGHGAVADAPRHGRRSARPDPRRRPAGGAPAGAAGRAQRGRAGRTGRSPALARQAAAPATLRAYRADWQHFADWCAAAGLRPGAGRAGRGRRLSRQPRRHPCAEHDPPPPRRAGQDAPVQRPAVEPGASRHPGAAARPAAPARPAGAEGGGADPRHAAPAAGHLRQHGARPARPGAAAVRLRRRAAPLRTGGAAGRGRGGRSPAGCGCGSPAARPTRPGRGPRSACRAGDMSRPARCGPSRPGRRWPSARPARCSAASAPPGEIGDAALHPDAVRRILAAPGRAWPG